MANKSWSEAPTPHAKNVGLDLLECCVGKVKLAALFNPEKLVLLCDKRAHDWTQGPSPSLQVIHKLISVVNFFCRLPFTLTTKTSNALPSPYIFLL